MESVQDLFEARVELKKFKNMNPKRVLQILQRIRECQKINRNWIRTTRITKTLSRISLHKYEQQDDARLMVIKLTKHLISKFKQLFPKLNKTALQQPQPLQQNQPAKQTTPARQEAGSTASKVSSAPPRSAESQPLPKYNNQLRNQGLSGFMKYFQKGLNDTQVYDSHTVCVEIEKYLFTKNSRGEELLEISYKNDVKKLCTQFLDKEAFSTKVKILEEFSQKKTGTLDSVKQLLK